MFFERPNDRDLVLENIHHHEALAEIIREEEASINKIRSILDPVTIDATVLYVIPGGGSGARDQITGFTFACI